MKSHVQKAMISSTSLDLPDHRQAAIEACGRLHVLPLVMEQLPATDADAIHVSLEMVDDADIYIGIYAWRYGHVPAGHDVSITEMEFNRAVERGIPILVFLIHEDHSLTRNMVEADKTAQDKLVALKERASNGRGRRQFKSPTDLCVEVVHALSDLKERQRDRETREKTEVDAGKANSIPKPPAFYAEPDYIGSHKFIGRAAQLQELTKWAQTDGENLLLFQAIGGNGKSMLTWEWTTNHAPAIRNWAGRFWYSFYERGAIMADFCRHALAYMTGRPLEGFAKRRTSDLAKELIAILHARPWLLILDGLERILVAYHRIDAAEVPDEEVNIPTDKIVNRNPCDAIRDEDADLLRAFAAIRPSKILVSSRLVPRVLLNAAGLPIPGVRPIVLPGLDESDAELLLKSCGVTGTSASIRYYLKTNCDNHPLIIGILGGLINHYRENRGNFDAWVADPHAGAALDLASLDLIQRRNHILRAALDDLAPESKQLLAMLALLSDSVDYETLKAFNPHLSPGEDGKLASPELYAAQKKLEATVTDLELRGLLQWDGIERKYNLHPVVRGVASGGMAAADRESHGQRVVDHFSAKSHRPYADAETMEDVRSGLHVVRTLLKIGHFKDAVNTYHGELARALLFNLEAHAETVSLLRPFFPADWGELPKGISKFDSTYVAHFAAIALDACSEPKASLAAYGAVMRADIASGIDSNSVTTLRRISHSLNAQNRLAQALRVDEFAKEIATLRDYRAESFMCQLNLFTDLSNLGRWEEASATWERLDPMGRDWSRVIYRAGMAEERYARFRFLQGTLQEEHLADAEGLAKNDNNRMSIRDLCRLRGSWSLEKGEWEKAEASFQEAVRLARERSLSDAEAETGLALAKQHLGQFADPYTEAERLALARKPAYRLLGRLWLACGNLEQARHCALAAYRWAWADGEPFVNRFELNKAAELLQQLDVFIPDLAFYDPAGDVSLPWEPDLCAAIESLRALPRDEIDEELK